MKNTHISGTTTFPILASSSSSSSIASSVLSFGGSSSLGKRKLAEIGSIILPKPLRDASYSVFQHCINTIASYNNFHNVNTHDTAPYAKLPDIILPEDQSQLSRDGTKSKFPDFLSASLVLNNTISTGNPTILVDSPESNINHKDSEGVKSVRKEAFPRTIDNTVAMIPTSFSLVNSGSNYLFRDDNALADGNTAIPIDHRNPTATTTTTTGTIIPPSNIHTTADEEELSRIFSLLFSEDDILYCPELGPSILRTWKEREIHNYRNIHGDRISRTQVSTGIRSHMRAQLVDWLIDVSNDFLVTLESGISSKMSIESVYKAIYMIDYMLSYRPIPIDQLQLLGATALFTATTLEEIIATFQPMDAVIFSGSSFTTSDVIRMQKHLLQTLDWQCEVPTPRHWLYPLWLASGCTSTGWRNDVCNLTRYITELGLLTIDIPTLVPSLQAAGAFYYARSVLYDTKGKLPPCVLQEATEEENTDQENKNNRNSFSGKLRMLPNDTENLIWPRELYLIVKHPLTAIIRTAILYQEKAHRKYGNHDSSLKAVYKKYTGTAYGRVAEKYAYALHTVDLSSVSETVEYENVTVLPPTIIPTTRIIDNNEEETIMNTTTSKTIPKYILESLPTIDRSNSSLQECSTNTHTIGKKARTGKSHNVLLPPFSTTALTVVPPVTRSISTRRTKYTTK